VSRPSESSEFEASLKACPASPASSCLHHPPGTRSHKRRRTRSEGYPPSRLCPPGRARPPSWRCHPAAITSERPPGQLRHVECLIRVCGYLPLATRDRLPRELPLSESSVQAGDSESGSGLRSAVEAIGRFINQSPGCRQGTILAPVAAWQLLPSRGAVSDLGYFGTNIRYYIQILTCAHLNT
jgi:hypothetical protein